MPASRRRLKRAGEQRVDHRVARDRLARAADFLRWTPRPLAEVLDAVKTTDPKGLLAETESAIQSNKQELASALVHRYGTLKPGDNIVLVVTASEHRDAAFDAAKFLMDYLKTSAPFWKRETGPGGSRWVEASSSDDTAMARWNKTKDAAE